MATAQANIHVRVNPEVKRDSEKILKEIGISMSDAVNMMLRGIIRKKGLPFEVSLEEEKMPGYVKIESVDDLRAYIDEVSEKNAKSKTYTYDEAKKILEVGRMEAA